MNEISVTDLLGQGLGPRTAHLYTRLLIRFSAGLAELGTDLERASAAQVAAVAASFPWAHSTRTQLRGALHHAWDLLERQDGPVRAVKLPPKPRGHCRALAAEEAALLERAAWARADEAGLAVLIGLYAGLRRAEIAGVHSDRFSWRGERPVWLSVMGKGGVLREIPVHPLLAEAILRHKPRHRLRGWLFPAQSSRTATPHVSPATVWDWVRQVGRQAGLPELGTHVLRHTALAEAHDRCGDLRAVQTLAGHARPETTTLYTRTTSERLTAVVGMISYGRRAS